MRERRWAPLVGTAMLLALAAACAAPPSIDSTAAACPSPATLAFVPDTGGLDEAYVCFGFDAGVIGDHTIGRVVWTAPERGSLSLHHAKLYAVPGDFPDGPVPCTGMPDGAVGLDVWAPGSGVLALPADTGLVLPPQTRRLVVEAHALRAGPGTPGAAAVALCAARAPVKLAGLLRVTAPVPAIRPHHEETSATTCTLGADQHFLSVWPHMHLVGKAIALEILRPAETPTPLVTVDPWSFSAQARYPLDADAAAGDRLHLTCTWANPGDDYVFPGPLTENEMCNASLITWPAANATCTPDVGL